MDSVGIKTWRERIGVGVDFPLHAPTDVERGMVAEITELRGLLQAQDAPKSAGAAQSCRSSEKVQVTQERGSVSAVVSPVTGTLSAALPPTSSLRMRAELAEEVLAIVLWLYRRLPHGYGRPPTVERPILALAKLTGIDVADCLAERRRVPSVTTEYEGMEKNK